MMGKLSFERMKENLLIPHDRVDASPTQLKRLPGRSLKTPER